MINKLLLTCALGICFATPTVFANGAPPAPVPYIAPAPAPAAFTPGVYIGVQGGYADTGWDDFEGSPDTWLLWSPDTEVNDDKGFGGRVFLGYDAYDWLAFELGYLYVAHETDITSKHSAGPVPANTEISDIRTQAIDLVGKLKSPTYEGFGLYAKAGVGYLMEDGRNKFADIPRAEDVFFKDDVDKFDLVYGLGLSYTIPNHDSWTFDLSWTRYESGHSTLDNEWQPDLDFYALGLMYKFNLY